MAKIIKNKTFERLLCSFIIATFMCLILSLIVYKGQYFQNWLNSAYASHKQIIIFGWFLLFTYYEVCLFCLWQTNTKERSYLFLFGIQFFAFAVFVISVYCFSAYILATVSSILSVIFSFWLVIKLFKNKKYVLMSFIVVLIMIYLYCVFCGILCCSLEYGAWND